MTQSKTRSRRKRRTSLPYGKVIDLRDSILLNCETMRIREADFIKSAYKTGDFPLERHPEIAVIGRSNVGKSSFINSLVAKKGLARISGTPGKTQLINFFKITPYSRQVRPFYLVDLPGYGYAKVPKAVRSQWMNLVETYLIYRKTLSGVVVLLDIRHGVSPIDEKLNQWIRSIPVRVIWVVSKADLLNRSRRAAEEQKVRDTMSLSKDDSIVFFSARTGEGRTRVMELIQKTIES